MENKTKKLLYLLLYNIGTEAKIVYKVGKVNKFALGYITSVTADNVEIEPSRDIGAVIPLHAISKITLYQKFKTIYEE